MNIHAQNEITRKTITRRKALGLMGTAALTTSSALLSGCSLLGLPFDMSRTNLVTGLLKEKYDREFVVTDRPYGFTTSYRPNAYCREAADEDSPVFEVEFYADEREEIISDTFIERKLGRQVEDYITECFAKQGIDVAVIGTIDRPGTDDPDISFDSFLRNQDEKAHYSFDMIIKDDINAKTDKRFSDALIEVYEKFDSEHAITAFIVKTYDFDEMRVYLRLAPMLVAKGMPKGKMIGGLLVYVENSVATIKDDNTWESSTYN